MKEDKNKTWSTLELAWSLGFQIALPLIIFALLGRMMDRILGTSPWLVLAGVLIATMISTTLVYRKVSALLKDIDKDENKSSWNEPHT